MIPPEFEARFQGDPGTDVVAHRIEAAFPNGERRTVTLRIGTPYPHPDKAKKALLWRIRSELDGLEPTEHPLEGVGSLDALVYGLRWIHYRLAAYESNCGCRYVWKSTEDAFDFRDTLTLSPKGMPNDPRDPTP